MTSNHTYSAARRIAVAVTAAVVILTACEGGDAGARKGARAAVRGRVTAQPAAQADALSARSAAERAAAEPVGSSRAPNELGRIPILEYHLIGDEPGQWQVTPDSFRMHLELLYERGYRPVNLRDVLSRTIDLPRGLSPVVFTFDDASPSQFRYIERADGTLEIDPESAVGIWLEFARTHPGWSNRAVFCMLPAAEVGRSFFGDKGIEQQKSAWRFRKVRFLHERGFELCNHTLWHANLSKYDDAFVQEQIARGELAIDSAIPGYDVRTFALPLGVWPKNRELAHRGSWTDSATGRTVSYAYDAVLKVAGGPARSPHDPAFDARALPRVIIHGDELWNLLDRLEREPSRYVADGDPATVARPAAAVDSPLPRGVSPD